MSGADHATHESDLADARAKALEFLADRDATRAALDEATAQIRELRESVAALIAAGHRDHEAELSEALGRKRSRYDTWRTLLEVVRERLDRPLEEKLRAIVGEDGKPDRTIPLPQLLDDIRWYAHVVTPERNELMEQQRQLLDVLSAKSVLTIVDDARRIVEERKRLSREIGQLRAEKAQLEKLVDQLIAEKETLRGEMVR